MDIHYLQKQLNTHHLADKINLKYVPTSLSTMEDAKEDSKQNLPTFYLAENQKNARGRFHRPFYTEKKNGIYLSIKLDANKEKQTPSQFILSMAVALCETISSYDQTLTPKIKWVNDVYINRKKCAGILAEGVLNTKGQLEEIILGMGINFSIPQENFPLELQKKVTSIFKKPPTSPEAFLISFIKQFLYWKEQPLLNIQKAYKELLFILNHPITFPYDGTPQVGIPIDITSEGQLVVQTKEKGTLVLNSGEISLLSF